MGPKSIIPDVTFGILFRYFSRPFSKVVLGRLVDRFLMDVGTILEAFRLKESIKIVIDFGIDFWIGLKSGFGTDKYATARLGRHLVPPIPLPKDT